MDSCGVSYFNARIVVWYLSYRTAKKIKSRLEKKEVVFNKKIFNTNFQCSKIVSKKAKPGSNLKKIVNVDLKDRVMQVLNKLVSYKIEDIKRKGKFKNFRSKKAREEKKKLLETDVNLVEFFYWYRIKSNYRDLEFLDKDIEEEQFKDFYKNYFELTCSFFEALMKMIKALSKTRLSEEIFNEIFKENAIEDIRDGEKIYFY